MMYECAISGTKFIHNWHQLKHKNPAKSITYQYCQTCQISNHIIITVAWCMLNVIQ